MQLIRNAVQSLRWHIKASQEERQYAKDRSRFGMSDAERRERTRREHVRGAVLQFVVVLVLVLAAIGSVGGA